MRDHLDDTAPRCPDCHTVLEVAGSLSRPFHYCPHCRVARLGVARDSGSAWGEPS